MQIERNKVKKFKKYCNCCSVLFKFLKRLLNGLVPLTGVHRPSFQPGGGILVQRGVGVGFLAASQLISRPIFLRIHNTIMNRNSPTGNPSLVDMCSDLWRSRSIRLQQTESWCGNHILTEKLFCYCIAETIKVKIFLTYMGHNNMGIFLKALMSNLS